MRALHKFYINGQWVNPCQSALLDVENPATETIFAAVSKGSAQDIDIAVAAAKNAFF